MHEQINDIVPLIRKHFDFLQKDFAFSCQRTWNEYMSRHQGAEYVSKHLAIIVEQPDSPIFEVHLSFQTNGGTTRRNLDEIIAPELWAARPLGHAWPRPIQEDDEQLRFLGSCLRSALPNFLREPTTAQGGSKPGSKSAKEHAP